MAENSNISWTHHTFNPWMGCVKVSDGCKNCYAESLVTGRMGRPVWGANAERHVTSDANWKKPLKWNREAASAGGRYRVFCASLCDVMEDRMDLVAPRIRLWRMIEQTPHLDWLLLTKRLENPLTNFDVPEGGYKKHFLLSDWNAGYDNVWLGTSVEDMRVSARVDALRKIPAKVRFISYEPVIGPINGLDLTGIHWLICGGESGSGYRPMELQWARDARDMCREQGVAFFFKQWSAFRPGQGDLDGEKPHEYPR